MNTSLNPYVTSTFQSHSLSGVPTALGDAFAAATYLPMAKLMDVWGRAEGFLFMVICLTIGLILMATCQTFETYCAANVSLQMIASHGGYARGYARGAYCQEY
jgi:MFS family permease